MLTDQQDALGHRFYDYLTAGDGQGEVIERDDGYIDVDNLKVYFSNYRDWHNIERKAMRHARGRVLDIGCGAGRHSLYLQEKGLEVVGIDNSPLAIEVCKLRGLKYAQVIPISQISSKMGIFDTILMLGNNFGLFGSFEGAKRLLTRLGKITSQNARIIAGSNSHYRTENPMHLAYHELNRKRGRMPGQLKLRVRYKTYASPWFDYLMVSKEEMEDILNGTGWKVNKYLEEAGNSNYIAIIDKATK